MLLLTEMNDIFDMNAIPDYVDDLHYCVLDYSNQADVDFIFPPLLYLDEFTQKAADIKIGPYRLHMPLNWSIVIGDKNLGSVEIIEISQINDRDFDAFCFNPMTSSMPIFHEIVVDNTYPDIKWHIPQLKYGHILAVPLTRGPNPLCAYFLKDTNKVPDHLDIAKIF